MTHEEIAELTRLANEYHLLQTRANQAAEIYWAYRWGFLKEKYAELEQFKDMLEGIDKAYKKTPEYEAIFKNT
jgi:hypothetical protein